MTGVLHRRTAIGLAALAAAGIPFGAQAAQKMEVSQYGQFLGGFPWIVALKQGFMRNEGVTNIDGFISSAGGGTAVRNLLASGLAFGEVASGTAVAAINQGLPLVLLYAATNSIGEIAWLTLPNKPINSIQDLAGKTVGYTAPKSTTELALRMSLADARVPTDKMTFVSTGGLGGALSMLKSGNIDAAPFADPNLTKSLSDFKLVFRASDYVPPLHYLFGITTPDFAKKNPDLVRKLIKARRDAVAWIYAHPTEAVAYCADFLEVDTSLATKIMPKFLLGATATPYWSPGNFIREGLASNDAGLRLIGALEGTVDWNKYVDQSYLPADLQTNLG